MNIILKHKNIKRVADVVKKYYNGIELNLKISKEKIGEKSGQG